MFAEDVVQIRGKKSTGRLQSYRWGRGSPGFGGVLLEESLGGGFAMPAESGCWRIIRGDLRVIRGELRIIRGDLRIIMGDLENELAIETHSR